MKGMKLTLILGNIITMDDRRPFAKAALVKMRTRTPSATSKGFI